MLIHRLKTGFRSLSITLTITFVSLSLGVLVIYGAVNTYFAYRAQNQAISDSQRLIAGNAANTVKGFVQDKVRTIALSSKLDNLNAASPHDKQEVLGKLLGLEPAYRSDMILDTKGNIVQQDSRLSSLEATKNQDFSELVGQVSKGQNYIGHIYINKATSEPLLLIATPIQNVFGDYQGSLVAEVNVKFMWDLVDQIKVGKTGQAFVVNKDGSLIAYKDTSRVLARENLNQLTEVKEFAANNNRVGSTDLSVGKGINGTQVATSHLALGAPDWAVVVEMPIAEAYAPVIHSTINSAIVIGLSALAATVISFYLSRRITKPLLKLKNVITKIADGDLTIRSQVASRNEIGELSAAFNTMTEGLQTSGQKLQEEHARLKSAIDSLDVGLLMTFKDEKTISYNTMLPYILGFNTNEPASRQDITLATLEKKLLTSKFDLTKAIDDCQKSGKFFEVNEITYGNQILSVFGAPIKTQGNAVIGTVVLIEDITEAKVMERSKDEFFSIASHELRTPLTSIKGNSSMILDYYKEVLKDQSLREMVEDMHTSAVRLIEIVNDFLDLSRLEQGKMSFNYEAVNIEKVIESVSYEMKPVLDEKKIYLKLDKLTLDELPPVWVDANRLKQVVYNLVGNAAKFTEQGGITISAKQVAGKDFVKVLVTDTGRGMTLESQQLLFHKFQQASSSILTRDTTRGTGLGLYISKMIVENMGGVISLDESIEDKGTVFSFTLPLATKERQASTAVSAGAVTDSTTGLTTPMKQLNEPSAAKTKPAPLAKS